MQQIRLGGGNRPGPWFSLAGDASLGFTVHPLCWGVVDYNDAQLERRKHVPRRGIPQNVL